MARFVGKCLLLHKPAGIWRFCQTKLSFELALATFCNLGRTKVRKRYESTIDESGRFGIARIRSFRARSSRRPRGCQCWSAALDSACPRRKRGVGRALIPRASAKVDWGLHAARLGIGVRTPQASIFALSDFVPKLSPFGTDAVAQRRGLSLEVDAGVAGSGSIVRHSYLQGARAG